MTKTAHNSNGINHGIAVTDFTGNSYVLCL